MLNELKKLVDENIIKEKVSMADVTTFKTGGIADMIVYPNPTNGILNLSLDNKDIDLVEVFDIAGRKIKSLSCVSQSVDLSTLPNGSYTIVVHNSDGIYSSKILIYK